MRKEVVEKFPEVISKLTFVVGRPSVYKPEYCTQLYEHMRKGLSESSWEPNDCTITTDTFYDWVRRHPDFAKAKEAGKRACAKTWESIGIHGVLGKTKNFAQAGWIFNMKARFGWRDNLDVNVNHSGEIGVNNKIDLSKLSVQELKQLRVLREKIGDGGTVEQLVSANDSVVATLPVKKVEAQ